MAVRYNQGTGMWFSDQVGGGYYSKADAEAAEGGGALSRPRQQSPDTLEFDRGGITEARPDDPKDAPNPNNPGGVSDHELARLKLRDLQNSPLWGDEYDKFGPIETGQDIVGYTEDSNGNRITIRRGTPQENREYEDRLGTVTDHGMVAGVQELGFEASTIRPPGTAGARTDAAAKDTDQAEDRFNTEQGQNAEENANAWNSAWGAIDDIEGGDYAMSDEARAFQKEGLQQQRDLLKRALGFDSEQYATQFADKALARNIALGRSQGTSAAAQQAGMFGAMEGSAELYAEGARQAAGIETTRLNTAEAAAKAFGELGTMTRNSDENRAQFESNLTVEIADQVSKLTQGQVALNQQESQMFAEMWMDFAQLQSVYAGMDSDEMIAWWSTEAQKRGQDKQLEAVLASLRADGAVTSKDLIGGLFQLGGGILGAGGQIGAAYAGKP